MKAINFMVDDEEHARYMALPRDTTHKTLWQMGLKLKEEKIDKEFEDKIIPPGL